LRFLSILKILYSRDAVHQLPEGLFACIQKRTEENLNADLGDLWGRIKKTLITRKTIRTGKTSSKPEEIYKKILQTTFQIAVDKKWLFFIPSYNDKNTYTFTMNPGFFDKKETAIRLKTIKSS